jgi:hypothetical protein
MSSTQTPRARRPFILPDSARTPSIPSIHTPPGKTQVRGKGYDKLASFSPGIDAMNAPYSPEAAQAQFDASITQSMYQRFGSKFPDLVPSLVTLRLLASDVDTGTAFGAFVLDIGDRVVYVPAVVNDSRLEELDIVYDKTTDQFAPLTLQQLRYLRNRGTNPMGTAEKLPQSVPTDVDIRALMLPPETGRYSYASADEMPSLAKRLPIEKTAGFAPEMAYASPKRQLEEAVLQHLAKSAPEVFDHLPEEQRAALLGQSGSDPMAPEMTPHVPHGHDGPVPGTIRTASAPHADFDADLAHMRAKIAAYRTDAVTKRASGPSTKLLSFLEHSPNAVKTAFVETMKADKHLASTIFRHYGPMKVAAAVRRRPPGTSILAEKRASVAEIPFRLGVATKEVEVQAFGPDSGKALRGVKLRGYYYRTEGMAPNRAITEPTTKNVATQVPRSGEAGAGLTGVLMLMKRDGGREAVLVISQPYDLDYGDAWDARSITQPSNASWPVAGALAAGMTGGQGPLRPERGRKNLIVWGDTSHTEVTCDVFGDPVPDSTLEGTKLWASLKAMGKPKLGRGIFLSKSGATIDGTSPLVIKTISTGPDGITRGTFQGGRSFECDPLSAIEKIVHTSAYDTLYLPASWKWVSLGEQRPERSWDGAPSVKSDYYLTSEDAAHALMHSLVSKSERASVMGDGISYVTSASPGMGKTKVAALVDLSKRYGISGADAEALLKMADVAGRSSALIVPRSGQLKKAAGPLEAAFGATLQDLQAQLQQLQGQISALTGVQQRASAMLSASPGGADPLAMQMTDPGMGAPAPGDAPMPDPAAMAADPAAAGAAPMPQDPNANVDVAPGAAPAPAVDSSIAAPTPDAAGAAAPAPGAAPPVDPAMAAGAPAAPAAAAPVDPAMAGGAPPVDPAMAGGAPPVDPAMAGGAPPAGAPMDPSMMPPQIDPSTGLNIDPQTGAPTGTSMETEGPAASQVQSQVNPNYLQAAGALDDAAVFDVGMLAEMQRAAAVSASSAALEALMPINTKDLAETVDDLGRALLNLYLRGTALNEQLGVQTQARMVGQIRRSFLGLGELLLDLRAYKAGARASLGNI